MGITFVVDDVDAVRERLATLPLADVVKGKLGVELHHVSHAAELVEDSHAFHPLLQAVHVAFAQHRPLALSPDHVWLTMAQGFATHLEHVGEALRSRFVRHDGKKLLTIEMDAPTTSAAWAAAIDAFGSCIGSHVGPGVKRLLECNFSTTTAVERVASGVVMMSAFKRYFDYELICICGIPEITLEGTPEDWLDIRRRLDVLAEYDLGWWAARLAPVLDELVKTAQGKPNRDFWQCIYKPEEAYGGDVATGWIMRLFPYIGGSKNIDRSLEARAERDADFENLAPILPPGARAEHEARKRELLERGQWIGPGISPGAVPTSWSDARLRLKSPDGSAEVRVLYGGLAGVRQLENGALRPEVTWAVGGMAEMTAMLENILAHHAPRPAPGPPGDDDDGRPYVRELPAELIELYDRMDGAVLFDRWEIPRRNDLFTLVGSVERGFEGLDPRTPKREGHGPATTVPAMPICLLKDDVRFLALYEKVVILCDPRVAQNPEEIAVVAPTTRELFRLLFQHQGRPWFDEEPPRERLYPHLGYGHEYLRRALLDPELPIPLDLDRREKQELTFRLWWSERWSTEQQAHMWNALKAATGTEKTREEIFSKDNRRVPMHALNDLGIG
jgi:hypothetical protein